MLRKPQRVFGSADRSPRAARQLARNRGGPLLLLFLSLAAGSAAPALRTDWPQFLGPTRNGVCPGLRLPDSWPKEGPPKVWERPSGQGYSGPVVAGGKLILFHRLGEQETVECLDAQSGRALWKKEYPSSFRDEIRSEDDGPRSTPAIDGNLVYTFGAEGMLSCWKLTTGEKVWSLDCQAKFMPPKGFFGIACSPLVLGEAVLLNIGGANGAGIVAFDKNNGKVLWQASRDEASYSSPVAAAIGEKQYAFFLTRKHLTALEPGNGKIIFEYPWTPRIQASVSAATPIVVGDLIFISASYGAGAALLRFHESGPDKIWSNDETLSNHYATSIYHEGFLYGFDGRQEQGCHLRCVEMKTGKVQWSKEGLGAGSLLLVKDQLLILTERGQLIRAPATPFGFKAAAQAQILPFTVRAYPAVAGDLLYARSRDKLVCLNLQGVP